ncbi:MAG: GbsR/MarR family transcriptional regulator [Sporichthyaceae bacterium]
MSHSAPEHDVMPGTAAEASDEFRTFVERMSVALSERGWPRMPARVYVVMLCHDGESLTARHLATTLGVSAAAISAAVNHLIEKGVLLREPVPGSRQDHYRLPPGDILGVLMRRTSAAPDLAGIADDGIALLGPSSPGATRLAELSELVRFVDAELRGVWARWQARQGPPG